MGTVRVRRRPVDLGHERHALHANIPLLGLADAADEAKQAASEVFDAWLTRSGLTPQLDNENRQPGCRWMRLNASCRKPSRRDFQASGSPCTSGPTSAVLGTMPTIS
jgi:hypothetical protein